MLFAVCGAVGGPVRGGVVRGVLLSCVVALCAVVSVRGAVLPSMP